MNRRLYRCRENRVLAGVAGGLAEYVDLDKSLVRVFWFLSIFVGGFGVLLYIAMAFIVPLEPLSADAAALAAATPTDGSAMHRHGAHGTGRVTTFVGIVLILFGAVALLGAVLPVDVHWGRYLWPAFVVAVGALLVIGAIRRRPTES